MNNIFNNISINHNQFRSILVAAIQHDSTIKVVLIPSFCSSTSRIGAGTLRKHHNAIKSCQVNGKTHDNCAVDNGVISSL